MKAGTTPPPDATVTVVLAVVCPPLTVMVYVPRLFGAGIEAVQLPEASVTFPVMTVPSLIVIVIGVFGPNPLPVRLMLPPGATVPGPVTVLPLYDAADAMVAMVAEPRTSAAVHAARRRVLRRMFIWAPFDCSQIILASLKRTCSSEVCATSDSRTLDDVILTEKWSDFGFNRGFPL